MHQTRQSMQIIRNEATAPRRRHVGDWADGRDSLTGLLNHRTFLDALSRARGTCRRHNEPLSLLMLDLDRFSQLNETYSRTTGDHVLAWVAAALQGRCRSGDVLSRYHWDRFAIALPGCSEEHACDFARRCCEAVFADAVPIEGVSVALRGRIGVAQSGPGFVETERDLIERAEQALAVAKRRSGQPVVGFSSVSSESLSPGRLDRASVDEVSRWMGAMRQQVKRTYLESTRALVEAVEAKDPHTRRHSLTVSHYAEALSGRLGLSRAQTESIKTAAILHDVGKIGIPDAILRKVGQLSPQEYRVVKQHPEIGLQILGHASFLNSELPLIRHHHEHYDGGGYPAGLANTEIPFGARVLAVADALDAMFSSRSYKTGYTTDQVRQQLNTGAGSQWDPVVTRAALDWIDSHPEQLATV